MVMHPRMDPDYWRHPRRYLDKAMGAVSVPPGNELGGHEVSTTLIQMAVPR